jgi:hypothetical protein
MVVSHGAPGTRKMIMSIIPKGTPDCISLDAIGREIVSVVNSDSDWVKVKDLNGDISYIPRSHLGQNKRSSINFFSHVASIIYLVPFLQYLMTLIF